MKKLFLDILDLQNIEQMLKILNDLFDKLNTLNYVILRNYHSIFYEVENGGDLDILCESRKQVLAVIDLKPRFGEEHIYNLSFSSLNQNIPIDIREIGDGYYDSKWEENMLLQRTWYKNFFIMNNENCSFSLLYHILVHKQAIADKYIPFLLSTFGTMESTSLIHILYKYMSEKKYKPAIPIDDWIHINKKNFDFLRTMLS